MRRANSGRWLVALLSALALFAGPALAHKKPKHEAAEQAQQQQVGPGGRGPASTRQVATASHGEMGEMMGDTADDKARMTTFERVLDWFGRLHPMIVHFPIAFFPAALFTAIVGRRRTAFEAPMQFLIVAGGLIAPIAAMLGWLDSIGARPDPLLTVHRWLGTAIGVGGLGLAIWALRRPDQNRSGGMMIAPSIITTAIVVQGWYGGALVHGIEHLNW